MEKVEHYDVEMKARMQKGHYDVQIERADG